MMSYLRFSMCTLFIFNSSGKENQHIGRMVLLSGLLLWFNVFYVHAQNNTSVLFASPLDIPLIVSSNFGELRTEQFHFGIDFKTGGKTGLSVHAVDSGYVCRIKVESGGYGRALYIKHPNGYMSVYAHLKGFNDSIGKYCKAEQYKRKSFSLDMVLAPGVLPVRKGEIIAYSGNAGYSFGPHLHFEIRNAKTEETLNVLRWFDFHIQDSIPPIVNTIWIYPMDSSAVINNHYNPIGLPVYKDTGTFGLINGTVVEAMGQIGIGIQAYDILNGADNKTGVYAISMYVNDSLVFDQCLDSLSFNEMRYVNSVMDYGLFLKTNERINRLFIQPNNLLPIYKNVKNRGILTIEDTLIHNVRICLLDANLNESEIHFQIKGGGITRKAEGKSLGQHIDWQTGGDIIRDNMSLHIPPKSIYDDIWFDYSKTNGQRGLYSDIFSLHHPEIPIHQSLLLRIRPKDLPERLRSKAIIVRIDEKNQWIEEGGTYKDNFIQTMIRSFGKFAIAVDTIPPVIHPLFSVKKKMNFSTADQIAFSIKDNLSGIHSFIGKIDGNWALFEYDAKDDLLYYVFDPARMQFGTNHLLKLTVIDGCGNIAHYNLRFFK